MGIVNLASIVAQIAVGYFDFGDTDICRGLTLQSF